MVGSPGPCPQSLPHHTSTLQQGTQHCQPDREQRRQTQASTTPAATTHHGGKLRHDDFKHTVTSQVWLRALPGTIAGMIPRDKAARSVVPGGTAPRGSVPRGILPRGMEPSGTQVSMTISVTVEETRYQEAHYPGRCDTPGGPVPRV